MTRVQTRHFAITRATYAEALAAVAGWVQERKDRRMIPLDDATPTATPVSGPDSARARYVCFCDAHGLANVRRDVALRKAYQAADAVFADGSVTMALAWIYGVPLPERVIGPYFFPQALQYGLARGWRHFFYGAGPGVAEELARRMQQQYPGLQVAGWITPPFRELTSAEAHGYARQIEAADTDLLWVALGCPKQERWAHAQAGTIKVPVILPVGAVFDFYSGRVAHAPDWVHPLGLRWLWRLLTGGRRTFRRNAWCVPRAAIVLAQEFVRVRCLRRRG
jgi:N-acetylglucosaminyldiphosphoundecaprenol N-acetyl-beta-D-mannosaminyltransferase